jgi:hypothetical protein
MRNKLFCFLVLLLSQSVFASDIECGKFFESGKFNDFFNCSLRDTKEIKNLEGDKKINLKEMESFKTSQPFEMSVSGLKGNGSSEIEAGIAFSILNFSQKENASKIQNANQELLDFEIEQKIAELYTQSILNMTRLQQIYEEIEVNDEILATFQSLKKRLESKIGMSPDDKVSLNLFHLNIATLRLDKLSLEDEIRDLEYFFKEKHDLDEDFLRKNLKRFTINLPSMDFLENKLDLQVLKKRYSLEFNRNEAEALLTNSQYGFSPKIGPVIKSSKENGLHDMSYGLFLSFSNPFSNIKSAANDTVKEKENKLSTLLKADLRAEKIKIDYLVRQYKSYSELLKDFSTFSSLSERNKSIRKLYLQGVVSGIAMVDSQLKMIEILKSKNVFSLKAYKTYFEIMRMTGYKSGEI